MQKIQTPIKLTIRRKAGWLLLVYLFCAFHHELADVSHQLLHLIERLFEHHHHAGHHSHHHHTYHVHTEPGIHHHQKSSDHSHPVLALLDWEDERDPANTETQFPKSRKQIDQHLGMLFADAPVETSALHFKGHSLVRIVRSLHHPLLLTPPPERLPYFSSLNQPAYIK